MSLRGALVTLDAGTELSLAVADAFRQAGCDLVPWEPGQASVFRGCDLAVTYGPMQSLMPLMPAFAEIAHTETPLFVWYTEQVPWPGTPTSIVNTGALLRLFSERAGYALRTNHSTIARLLSRMLQSRAERWRGVGEMLELKRSGSLRLIGAFTQTNVRLLGSLGLPLQEIPMGYHPIWGQHHHCERDLDVLFLGSLRDRRRRAILNRLDEKLGRLGVKVVIKDGSRERGYAFGRDREMLLNRSKLTLNIMRQPWDDPVFRLLLAAPNGAMVLSERLLPTSSGPFQSGVHFAESGLDEMIDSICDLLAHPQERGRLAEAAQEFVIEHLTMPKMAHSVLKHLGLAHRLS